MLDPERPLYFRLGGYDAVAAFADELLLRLMADPVLGLYWKGKCTDSRKRDRQLLVDFLCAVTGGPVHYSGRDMRISHAGLGITESEWNLFVAHTVAVLDELGVAEREKSEVLSTAGGFKEEIVEVRGAAGAGR